MRFNEFQIRFKLRLTTLVKASNIFHVERKTKKMVKWIKTHSNACYGHYVTTNQRTSLS